MKTNTFAMVTIMTIVPFFTNAQTGINTMTPRSTLEVNGTFRVDSTKPIINPKKIAVLSDSNTLDYVSTDTLKKMFNQNNDQVKDMIPLGMNGFGTGSYNPLKSYFRNNDSVITSYNGNNGVLVVQVKGKNPQVKDILTDFPAVLAGDNKISSGVVLGTSLYLMIHNIQTGVRKLARYNALNITAAPTIMTFSGSTVLINGPVSSSTPEVVMSHDGSYFYFNHDCGNTTNDNIIAKYSLSGTTLNYISSTTLVGGNTHARSYLVHPTKGYITRSYTDLKLRVFDFSGNQTFSALPFLGQFLMNQNNNGLYSFQSGGSSMFYEIFYVE